MFRFIDLNGVNYLAILVSALVPMVLGMIWYAPAVFGKTWMHLIGKSESELKKGNMGVKYLLSFVGAIITAYVLDQFYIWMGIKDIVTGVQLGILLWLGLVLMTTMGDYMWPNRPLKLYILNNAFQLISILGMTAILVAWK